MQKFQSIENKQLQIIKYLVETIQSVRNKDLQIMKCLMQKIRLGGIITNSRKSNTQCSERRKQFQLTKLGVNELINKEEQLNQEE